MKARAEEITVARHEHLPEEEGEYAAVDNVRPGSPALHPRAHVLPGAPP